MNAPDKPRLMQASARLLFRTAEGRLIRHYGSINRWAREIAREIDPEFTGDKDQ